MPDTKRWSTSEDADADDDDSLDEYDSDVALDRAAGDDAADGPSICISRRKALATLAAIGGLGVIGTQSAAAQDATFDHVKAGFAETPLVGTTSDDPGPLDLQVDDARAMRYEATEPTEAANLVGGHADNVVAEGVVGATIAGGGGYGWRSNRVAAVYGAVGGGRANRVHAGVGTIGGGQRNQVCGPRGTIAGGHRNVADGSDSTVAGGRDNRADSSMATVAGGRDNEASGDAATIGGGRANAVDGAHTVVAGGRGNAVEGVTSTIGGGSNNVVDLTGVGSTIGGGIENAAAEPGSTVGGGVGNGAIFANATVGGGSSNLGSEDGATVGGGTSNVANAPFTTVGGGDSNEASDEGATVGGGRENDARGEHATVAGGEGNAIEGTVSSIGGGSDNVVDLTGHGATVGGGVGNRVAGAGTTVGGGIENTAAVVDSTVGGGRRNRAMEDGATVGGGSANTASQPFTTVGGGDSNEASGWSATVPGGVDNRATGVASFAAGTNAVAGDDGSFVWADDIPVDADSWGANTWTARSVGGAAFVTGVDVDGGFQSGVWIPPGDGSWQSLCGSDAKTNVEPVDPAQILERLTDLSIARWEYETNEGVSHVGPTAEEFNAAFDVGDPDSSPFSSESLSMVDVDGVALAAIQALTAQLDRANERIADLECAVEGSESAVAPLRDETAALSAEVESLRERLDGLEEAA